MDAHSACWLQKLIETFYYFSRVNEWMDEWYFHITVYSVQCTVYSVQCTVYSVQWAYKK